MTSSKPRSDLWQTRIDGWLSQLARRELPHFNQVVIWTLLGTAVILAGLPFHRQTGERAGTVSLFSWLPDGAVNSGWVWLAFRLVIAVGVVLWLRWRWLPWSCWLTVLGFTGLWSLHVETAYNTAHIFNLANMLLAVQAIWITADARLIRRRCTRGDYWTTPLVPRWVALASIAYIGLFHTAAGLSKLHFSGPRWASGTSLQIWAYLWGYSWSPATWLILASRRIACLLQALTLLVETGAVLAVFPSLRPWMGAGLLAFYAGVLATFDYGFEFNAVLTALYLLPCQRCINGAAARRMPAPQSPGRPQALADSPVSVD